MTNKKLPYGYGLAFPTLLGLTIRRLNLKKWSIGFWTAGFGFGFLYSYIRRYFISADVPSNALDYMMGAITFFLLGFPGFLFVCRKEAVIRGGIIRGRVAVIIGLISMLSFWGMGIKSMVEGIRMLIGQL